MNTKIGTDMIWLKNKVKVVLRFLKHFPLPVMKMLIFNTRSMATWPVWNDKLHKYTLHNETSRFRVFYVH